MQATSCSRCRMRLVGCSVFVIAALSAIAHGQPVAEADTSLRELMDAYVTAWNAGDMAALDRLWADGGELVSASGMAVDRKVLLGAQHAQLEGARPRLELHVKHFRQLDENVALVDGETTLVAPDGAGLKRIEFSGALVKQNGTWRIRLIRELSSHESPPAEPLNDLEWMVGEWIGLGKGVRVHVTSQWDMGQRFIVSRFHVEPENGEPYEATQRIGWDPQSRTIKSWYFDSRGSISTGSWAKEGASWLVTIHGTQHDGKSMSGTSAITPVDTHSYLRTLAGARISGASVPDQELRVFRVTEQPLTDEPVTEQPAE